MKTLFRSGRFSRRAPVFLPSALFLFFFVFFAFFAGEAGAAPSLAVRTFENKTDEDSMQAPAQAVTDMMTTELYNAGLFSLMERERLDYVAAEIRLGQSGLVDSATAPQVGKIQAARYTMTGAVTQYRYNAGGGAIPIPGLGGGGGLASKTALVVLEIRVIDNTTGAVVYAAKESGRAKREIGGLATKYGGFVSGSYGGILAAAAREAVMKHVANLKRYDWE
ncbi:MAG: CsgG/HfaB family protein [Synergistaceae bacterium]|jgi:curli biogenesis system outer membrane secretion channel CsgG|nr:CsgG/HfaB family protein [Synergistaceae bacterium]